MDPRQAAEAWSDKLKAIESSIPVPEWDELVDGSLQESHIGSFASEVNRLKKRPRHLLFGAGRLITRTVFRDPTYTKFVHSSWEEVVDIITSQMAENHRLGRHKLKEKGRPDLTATPFPDRRYAQQPCTSETVRRRARFAIETCDRDDAILLLGDDDLVGLELARNGFTNITIVDIDQRLLDSIARQASQEKLTIGIHQHDLRKPAPAHLQNDFELVYLDPFYSLEGVRLFLGAAIDFSTTAVAPRFFLSVHLLSLMKDGLNKLPDLFEQMGVELIGFDKSFNHYPMPRKARTFISVVNRTLTRSKVIRKGSRGFNHFVSDALCLRRSCSG